MAMNTPFSEFAGGINSTVDAYRANPAPLQQEVRQNSKKPLVDQSLVKLIAASMLNEEQKAKEQEINRALNPPVNTVADQTINQLTRNKEMEIARRVGMVNQQKARERRRRMDAMGIGGLPTSMNQRTMPQQRPTMQAAGGGIVAFQPGGDVVADDTVEVDESTFQDIYNYVVENPNTALATAVGGVTALLGAASRVTPVGKLTKIGKKALDLYKEKVAPAVKSRASQAQEDLQQAFGRGKVTSGGNLRTSESISEARRRIGGGTLGAAGASELPDVISSIVGEGEEAKAPEVVPQILDYTGTTVEQQEDKAAETDADKLLASADASAIATATEAAQNRLADIAKNLEGPTTRADTISMDRSTARGTLVDAQGEARDAIRSGIGTLKEAYRDQTTDYDTLIKNAEDRADMLAGRGEYEKAARIKEFLNSLATVGGGGNLGEGLARGFGASMAQEDVRRLRGAEADKETAALQKERADNLVAQAETLFSAESNLAQIIADNVKDLSTFDADTQNLILKATELSNATARAIQSVNVDIVKLGLEGELAKVANILERLNINIDRDKVTAAETRNTIDLLNILQDNVITILAAPDQILSINKEERDARKAAATEQVKPIQEKINELISLLLNKMNK